MSAAGCALDGAIAYNTVSTAYCANYLASSELSGAVYVPGVYCSSGFTIAQLSYFVLDGQNGSSTGSSSVWMFQTLGSLVMGADSSMILKNDAYPMLTFELTAQYTFLDNAPFLSIMLESAPITSDPNVWNIHTDEYPVDDPF